jgi:hypothetical protein
VVDRQFGAGCFIPREAGSLGPVSTEGNTTKCDACGRERRMGATSAVDIADLPDAVKHTYERLGIPEAERTYRSGVTQAAAWELGWKSIGGSDYCPDCG